MPPEQREFEAKCRQWCKDKGITIWPGPVVGIKYGPGDRQVLESDLTAANKEAAEAAKPNKVKAKRK